MLSYALLHRRFFYSRFPSSNFTCDTVAHRIHQLLPCVCELTERELVFGPCWHWRAFIISALTRHDIPWPLWSMFAVHMDTIFAPPNRIWTNWPVIAKAKSTTGLCWPAADADSCGRQDMHCNAASMFMYWNQCSFLCIYAYYAHYLLESSKWKQQ